MKNFIKGFILGFVGLTILDSLKDVICAVLEWIKSIFNIKSATNNKEMNKFVEEETDTRAIGFATTFEEDEEIEE